MSEVQLAVKKGQISRDLMCPRCAQRRPPAPVPPATPDPPVQLQDAGGRVYAGADAVGGRAHDDLLQLPQVRAPMEILLSLSHDDLRLGHALFDRLVRQHPRATQVELVLDLDVLAAVAAP